MESDELKELSEQARESGQKAVGLTTAIVAVLLAVATMLGHRSHTEEVLIQTRANDQWAYYQAKSIRAHMYEANADMAAILKGEATAAEGFRQQSEKQRNDAEQIREKASELESEVRTVSRRADKFDGAEIFLEIAIVLCSITLLTGNKRYWTVSFLSAGIGIVLAGVAFLIR